MQAMHGTMEGLSHKGADQLQTSAAVQMGARHSCSAERLPKIANLDLTRKDEQPQAAATPDMQPPAALLQEVASALERTPATCKGGSSSGASSATCSRVLSRMNSLASSSSGV